MSARVRCIVCPCFTHAQKRARIDEHVLDLTAEVLPEHVLDIIAEVLPVREVPEWVLEHLVGHDGLTDNDLKVLENRLGMTKEHEAGSEVTLLGGVEHSFDDHPSYVDPLFRRWTRNGELHRSSGPAIITMDHVHGKQMYYHGGSLVGWKK
jgi:hypothetical protein